MKKITLIALALATSFGLGFAFNNFMVKSSNSKPELKRVTSIGGIFFKCKDPKKRGRGIKNIWA